MSFSDVEKSTMNKVSIWWINFNPFDRLSILLWNLFSKTYNRNNLNQHISSYLEKYYSCLFWNGKISKSTFNMSYSILLVPITCSNLLEQEQRNVFYFLSVRGRILFVNNIGMSSICYQQDVFYLLSTRGRLLFVTNKETSFIILYQQR